MSIATSAFEAALERLNAQVVDPPERRPAYDVFGPAPAPLPALGGVPRAGAIAAAARALETGEATCVELAERALARIARDEWTAFVEVCAQDALSEAHVRDAELKAGRRRGALHGIPVSVKDVIDVRGVRTRCGSDAYDVVPVDDADAVELWRAAGTRIDARVSVPSDARPMPVASAIAEPPLDPPGNRVGSCGLRACGLVTPSANSCVDVLPRITAPAARQSSTASASSTGTTS